MRNEILTLLPPDYPWGQELLCFQEIGSTNTELKAMAKAGAPEGTALIALRQTGDGAAWAAPSSQNLGAYI